MACTIDIDQLLWPSGSAAILPECVYHAREIVAREFYPADAETQDLALPDLFELHNQIPHEPWAPERGGKK